jgi:hypothetical protein
MAAAAANPTKAEKSRTKYAASLRPGPQPIVRQAAAVELLKAASVKNTVAPIAAVAARIQQVFVWFIVVY